MRTLASSIAFVLLAALSQLAVTRPAVSQPTVSQPTPSRPDQEQTLVGPTGDPEDTVDAFHVALKNGDREAALELLVPEVFIFESGGAEMSRDEYASHHLGGDMKFSAAVDTEIVDRHSGSSSESAWVLTRSRTRGTYGDREIDAKGTETMVLVKSEDSWRIVHIHWSSRSR